MDHLQIVDPTSKQVALEVPNGHVSIDTIDLLTHNVRLQSIELKNPKLFLVQSDVGFNVASWVRTAEATNPSPLHDHSSSPWKFSLPVVKWTGGELTLP